MTGDWDLRQPSLTFFFLRTGDSWGELDGPLGTVGEEEEETEGTIWKPENGKGQQKVWSLRDSGDDFAMFSFKIGTSDGPKTGRRCFSFEAGRRQSRDLFSEIFAALARFFSNKKSLSLSCL